MQQDSLELIRTPSITGAEAIAIACRKNPRNFGPREVLFSEKKDVSQAREIWMRYWRARGVTGKSPRRGPAGDMERAFDVLRLSDSPGKIFNLLRDHGFRLPTELETEVPDTIVPIISGKAKAPGRPKGTSHDKADGPLVEKMRALVASGSAASLTAAAKEIVGRDGSGAAGSGTLESKVRRLVDRARKHANGE